MSYGILVNIASGINLFLMGPCHYMNQNQLIISWVFSDRLLWNSNENAIIFMEENLFQNVVCKMSSIVFRILYVNWKYSTNKMW